MGWWHANTRIQTCRRLVDIAISPHVMSAPNSLHTLRNGRLPTFGRGEGGREEREVNLHALLCYIKSYSCEWCQKEFVTKINLRKKKNLHDSQTTINHYPHSHDPHSHDLQKLKWMN